MGLGQGEMREAQLKFSVSEGSLEWQCVETSSLAYHKEKFIGKKRKKTCMNM